MEIRKMTEADLPEVCAIEQDIFSQPWSEEDFRNALKDSNNCYLVAVIDKIVIGYCGYWGIAGEGDIYNVAVKEDLRGQKIGFRMMTELINEAKSRGIASLTLEVRISNLAARHLYETLGFEAAGIRKDFYSKPKEDAVIMWLKPIQ
jgi:ribosomal-protein-alanine N-acetyltransferase